MRVRVCGSIWLRPNKKTTIKQKKQTNNKSNTITTTNNSNVAEWLLLFGPEPKQQHEITGVEILQKKPTTDKTGGRLDDDDGNWHCRRPKTMVV